MTRKEGDGGIHCHRQREIRQFFKRNEFIPVRRGRESFRVCFIYMHLPDLMRENMTRGTDVFQAAGGKVKLRPAAGNGEDRFLPFCEHASFLSAEGAHSFICALISRITAGSILVTSRS